MPATRAELEAALASAMERREAIHARAALDLAELHKAADEAKAAIAKIVADTKRCTEQALSEDAAAETEITRLTALLAAPPKET